jgi:hypothetical protein
MSEELGRSLEQLTATIQEQNKELKQKDSMKELDQSITALEKSGGENSARLRETLTQIQLSLDSATNEEQMELAREQLDALQGLAGTEEENRESARRQEEANEFLSQLVSGIDGLADAYDKQLDAMKPSAGLLAGLGTAALLFMDPETLFAGIRAAIDGVFAIVDSIKMFLDGDFSEGFALLGDNIGAVAAIVGTVAVLFGGRIIRLVGSLVKGVRGIIRAVSKVGRFIGALAGRFGGLVKIFGRLFLPFTIITGAIGAIQGAIDGFKEDGILGGLEGGISGLLTTIVGYPLDLLKSAVAWIAGKFGFENAEATLNEFSFSTLISDTIGGIFDMIKGAFDWIGTLFTDPVAALQQAWNGLVGTGGLIDIIYSPIDKAIAWIQGLFGWGNPEEPFKLSTFIPNAFADVKTWFLNKLTFGADLATEGWTDLSTFVSTKFIAVKDWFTGLFSWASDGLSEGWTNLTDFVKGKWTATKEWFTGLFSWNAEEGQENFILDLFNSTIEKVKTFFTDLFDFLPSFAEIKASLTSMLPEWMKPDSIEDQRAELIDQLAAMEAAAANALPAAEQFDNPLTNDTREDFEAEAAAIRAQLAELPQANKGGFMNAPASGGLAMLHGAEIVAPLDSPQGKVLMAINDLMNAKSAAGAGEYGGMGGPMIIQGGSNSSSNNTNNVSTSSYTIQQGITPDDFLKRDFLNFSY